jgi:hypothetical protein
MNCLIIKGRESYARTALYIYENRHGRMHASKRLPWDDDATFKKPHNLTSSAFKLIGRNV